jgi:YD repeat-containing protein
VESYTLDANGNRTAWTNSAGSSSAVPDARDRIESTAGAVGVATYVHDALGRVRERRRAGQVMRLDYDPLGALMGVTLEDGGRADYVTDALGRRVARRVAGTLDRQR